jgi:hypothetical protein
MARVVRYTASSRPHDVYDWRSLDTRLAQLFAARSCVCPSAPSWMVDDTQPYNQAQVIGSEAFRIGGKTRVLQPAYQR